jgi:hypothetical protein
MSKASPLTAEEKSDLEAQLAQLDREIAAAETGPEKLPNESDKFRGRLLSELEKAGIKIVGEAGGAAVGQKAGALAGAPLAIFTSGLSIPIGAAIGGFTGGMGGYEATTRGLGEVPTMRGRLQAGLMGAIPFAPEARLATGAAGQLAKVTGREMAESGLRMGAASTGAVVGAAALTGETDKLTPSEVILPAVGGAAGGAAARYVGAATAGSAIEGERYLGQARAAGPSSKAASEIIRKAQNVGRDQDLLNWEAIGGVIDPRIVNPNKTTKALQVIAGESDEVTRSIQNANTTKATEIARYEIGIPAEAEFTLDIFRARAQELKKVYTDIKLLGRAAKTKVDDVEEARDIVRQSWRIWKEAKDLNKGTTPALLETAKKSSTRLTVLENQLEVIVNNAGRQDLSDLLAVTRPQLAKIAVIESAVNPGRRTIDVSVIGNLTKDAPKLLTGNLGLMGRIWDIQQDAFQMAPTIQAAVSTLRASNTRRLPAGMAVGGSAGGSAGYFLGGPAGAAAGGAAGAYAGQKMTNTAFNLLTGEGGGISSALQRGLARPQYGTNVPSDLSLFLAKSGAPAGSNAQSFIDRYRQEQQGLSPSR